MNNWNFLQTFTTLVQCKIPLDFKSIVIDVLHAICDQNPAISMNILELLQAGNVFNNLLLEFDKIETENGSFYVTNSHIEFFSSLVDTLNVNGGLIEEVLFVKIFCRVFVQLEGKTFKNEYEKYQIYWSGRSLGEFFSRNFWVVPSQESWDSEFLSNFPKNIRHVSLKNQRVL